MCANNEGTISGCYNSGDIVGETNIAGICGSIATAGGTVSSCYNSGNVTASSEYGYAYAGGVCANNIGGTVNSCYNTGTVSKESDSEDAVAGIICGENYDDAAIKNCFYLQQQNLNAIGSGSGDATAKTSAEFASGAMCWLLNAQGANGAQFDTPAWYQTIGENADSYPVLDNTHGRIYKVEKKQCPGDNNPQTVYSNANEAVVGNHLPESEYTQIVDGGVYKHYRKCTICGNAADTVTACSGGAAMAVCAVCGNEYGDINANNHSWGAPIYKWSGDEKTCTAVRICTNDPSHTETATALVTGKQTKAPTCTDMGETTYTAVFAEEWAEEQTVTLADIPAVGHTFEWKTDKEATQTEAGSKHEECAVCGYAKEAVNCSVRRGANARRKWCSQNLAAYRRRKRRGLDIHSGGAWIVRHSGLRQ